MAIDSAAKRSSVQAYTVGLLRPPPDGTISAEDRAQLAWFYQRASTASITLTDVDTDEILLEGQEDATFTGTNLGAAPANRVVRLIQGSVSVIQAQVSGDANGGVFDVNMRGNLDLKFGAATFRLTRDDAASVQLAVTLNPAAGELYVDIVTPFADQAGRLRAFPDIAANDQIHIQGRGGGPAPAGLTVNDDGTFEFASGSPPTAFDVRLWSATQLIWREFATQYMG